MIITFPNTETPKPSLSGASRKEIFVGRIRELAGEFLLKRKIPSFIDDCSIEDRLTGQRIEICNGVLSTKITINGRDYYFDRFTGKLTGTGLGCS